MIRVAVRGATGKLGREVVGAVADAPDLAVVAAIGRSGGHVADIAVTPTLADDLDVDVLVDATNGAAVDDLVAIARPRRAALLVATTGLDDGHGAALRELSVDRPVLVAPNLSVGVSAVASLLPLLAGILEGADVELVEMHHRDKLDAPSGTARMWIEAVRAARPTLRPVHGREGATRREANELGVHALRGGGVAGEHRIVFAADGERVEVVHRAESRRAFALGAVRAVRFLASASPGLYDPLAVFVPASPGSGPSDCG